MADRKISALTAATTPLDGTEVLPIVQSSSTVKVANNDLRPKQIQSNATSGVLQVVGPAAASVRVMTTPNANFTVARTDAAQTFTGDQTFASGIDVTNVIIARGGVNALGDVYPAIDNNGWNIGKAANRWSVIYAATGTINTSDANNKEQVENLSVAELKVAQRIKGLVKKFKFKDAVIAKGDNARIHVGVIAQDVHAAFAAEGLDASKYGLFCSDTWHETNEDSPGAVEVTRLGVRYEELLAFLIAAM